MKFGRLTVHSTKHFLHTVQWCLVHSTVSDSDRSPFVKRRCTMSSADSIESLASDTSDSSTVNPSTGKRVLPQPKLTVRTLILSYNFRCCNSGTNVAVGHLCLWFTVKQCVAITVLLHFAKLLNLYLAFTSQ